MGDETGVRVNALEALVEFATIEFSKPVSEEQAVAMFQYLATQGVKSEYAVQSQYRVSPVAENASSAPQLRDQYIDGLLVVPGDRVAWLHFKMEKERFSDDVRFTGLKFATTPGDSVDELKPEEREGMDKVRQYISDYFSN